MHTDPDLLALLAMGEAAGTTEDHDHVTTCAGCRAELAELTRIVGVGQRSDPAGGSLIAPPDHVWAAIRHELNLHDPQPRADRHPYPTARDALRGAGVAPAAIGRPAPARRAAQFVLAAAVALIAGLGGAIIAQQPDPVAGPKVEARMNALPAWPGASGTAALETDASGARFLVVNTRTATPVRGVQEVWMSDSEAFHMRSMGTLEAGKGRFPVPADVDLKTYQVVDVSVEPLNDTDPEHHSGVSMLRCRLPL